MMGFQPPPQRSLFYTSFHLDKRIRKNHPLRKIHELIDFDFLYDEVRDKYGNKGNVSVAPPVILKLMILLVFYNVRSERELMETLPERLDWLWFLGYDLDATIPNHSVLSKARIRWGTEIFQQFFERIVWQCVEARLVDGQKLFLDSSLIDADASNNSVVDTHSLKRHLNNSYRELENRLADKDEITKELQGGSQGVNARYVSTTDPDASIVRRGKPKLQYQTHRAVDPGYEVITATEMTPGAVNEAHRLTFLLDSHQENTGKKAETVVADSKYGTIENYLACYDRGVKAHIPDLDRNRKNKGRRKGIFSEDRFSYDQESDTYQCPAGKILKPQSLHKNRQSIDYSAPRKECARCELRPQCTSNKTGRTIKRHLRQNELDQMRFLTKTAASRSDIRTRKHLMERTFANAKRYDFDRARWRGLWRVSIQEYLTATIQNIQKLITHGKYSGGKSAIDVSIAEKGWNIFTLSNQFKHCRYWQTPNLEY